MSDVNYVITIKGEGIENGFTSSSSHYAPPADGEVYDGFDKFAKNMQKCLNAAPAAYALKYLDLAAVTRINRVELRTGNALLQEKISFQYDMSKRLALSGAAFLGGISTGNIALAISGAASIANVAIQYNIERKNIEIARTVESIGLEQAAIRAGVSGVRR